MLKTRIATAIVMLTLFLSALHWLPQPGWAAFSGLLLLAAAWEWARLIRLPVALRWPYAIAIVGACAALWMVAGGPDRQISLSIYALACAFWLLAVPVWLWRGWKPSRPVMLLTGAMVLVPTWLALVQLRGNGQLLLLMVMAVVWISDIAAYFAGRRFGRRKLAPSISPGKTWEGVGGAMLAISLYGAIWTSSWQAYYPSLFRTQAQAWMYMLLLLWLLTAVGVYGDLFESAIKRTAGMKDSGTILPGHGGMLDRIDALTSALPVAALAYLL